MDTTDELSPLLASFNVQAGLFYRGGHCGVATLGEGCNWGHLTFLQSGRMQIDLAHESHHLTEPTLMFFPRPYTHRFVAGPDDQPQILCASLTFDGGAEHPICRSLPDCLFIPLRELSHLDASLQLLFAEAQEPAQGRTAALNRLFEVVLIQILRHVLATQRMPVGLMAGLSDKRLARALAGIHQSPGTLWTLDSLAATAGMSRARFASVFLKTLGQTPGDYLLHWRVVMAQRLLRQGQAVKRVGEQLGYATPSALARAFRRVTQTSPTEWLTSTAEKAH